ncbi:MAG: tol-pal system-associated acyl-CoA thioesterase [Stenotrophomonas nitritireducens]|uniref:tol-pal system-associated acyl-CoA thioesterase n=1 Tax=Stenotrophomonas nitritireducens TaxID=83617 RepID=UPI001AD5D9E7|nr:tol-pal system-associated acyl-CoA thioesterase [Stenotrophomonas nitritireducens]MBN8791069.1 tol-pal system-associated acyl-CoA thioesterase [Stenotrophomonas nitritireducens]MBN8796543.1 tol-pal system-associated acyl-CoA thioesterase [Stenotrophomonas nitritireducens]
MSIEARFSWPTRIYWEDTDAGGVVYHARYVAFMERARTEWMRAMGYGQEAMRSGEGQVFVVRAMTLDFLKPARLDDALQTTVELLHCRRASLVIGQAVLRDGLPMVTAQVRLAAVGARDFRPQAMDDTLYATLKQFETQHAQD